MVFRVSGFCLAPVKLGIEPGFALVPDTEDHDVTAWAVVVADDVAIRTEADDEIAQVRVPVHRAMSHRGLGDASNTGSNFTACLVSGSFAFVAEKLMQADEVFKGVGRVDYLWHVGGGNSLAVPQLSIQALTSSCVTWSPVS